MRRAQRCQAIKSPAESYFTVFHTVGNVMFFGHIRWRALGRSRVGKGNAERLMKSACRTITLGKLNKILDSQSLRRKRNHETGIKFLIKHTLP